MSRTLRVIGIIFVVIAILSVVLLVTWSWFTRQAFPQTSGTIQVPGLSQPVEVIRDEYGVAHIYAHSPEDLFFAEGYVHAQERFWQMEFQRRLGSGRLSELLGETTLGTDRYLRHFGFRDLSAQTYDLMGDETRRILDAYAAGVNAYISGRDPAQLGLEFALLGLQGVDVQVEPWTPVDSLVWGEMMIFGQSDQLRTELRNVAQLAAVGEDMYADLHPYYRDDRPVIIASEELDYLGALSAAAVQMGEAEIRYVRALGGSLVDTDIVPPLLADLGIDSLGGSNSFAISGEMTDTGMPLLANDPHMGFNMPALWYEIGMHCAEKSAACIYDFRGFSLPGVPGILIGHNDRIAWGLTNAAFDAEDVFIERVNPANSNQYEVNGEWVDMDIHREEIEVHGWEEPEVVFVRSTRNGVVATDSMVEQPLYTYEGDDLDLFALSYAWTALEPVRSIEANLKVLGAQDFEDFVSASQYFDAGKQNWLYADVDGNIGYIMPGKVPIRAGGDGSLPVPGWNDDYIWTGFIPYEEAPRVYNPTQGFIVAANNPQVRYEDYPYLINTSQDRGQRAQRITNMIQNDADGISIDDMAAIQTDNQDLAALELLPYLQNLQLGDPGVVAARDWLLGWEGQTHMDSPEAALYNIFWVHLITGIFHDQLPEDLRPGGNTVTADIVHFLLLDPQNVWWDDITTPDRLESRDDILAQALEGAYAEGLEAFGENLDQWRWGELHTITFRNATLGNSGISFIENIFNRGPFATSGSDSVVQKTNWDVNQPYAVSSLIPALRQVIDLGDLSNSRMIHSVGQSGHPGHPQYDHFIDPWRFFEYHPSNWRRAEVEAGDHDILILDPGS
jgi:penicillin amidase